MRHEGLVYTVIFNLGLQIREQMFQMRDLRAPHARTQRLVVCVKQTFEKEPCFTFLSSLDLMHLIWSCRLFKSWSAARPNKAYVSHARGGEETTSSQRAAGAFFH